MRTKSAKRSILSVADAAVVCVLNASRRASEAFRAIAGS